MRLNLRLLCRGGAEWLDLLIGSTALRGILSALNVPVQVDVLMQTRFGRVLGHFEIFSTLPVSSTIMIESYVSDLHVLLVGEISTSQPPTSGAKSVAYIVWTKPTFARIRQVFLAEYAVVWLCLRAMMLSAQHQSVDQEFPALGAYTPLMQV